MKKVIAIKLASVFIFSSTGLANAESVFINQIHKNRPSISLSGPNIKQSSSEVRVSQVSLSLGIPSLSEGPSSINLQLPTLSAVNTPSIFDLADFPTPVAGNMISDIQQSGKFNSAAVLQFGDGQVSSIYQYGSNNTAIATQSGFGNVSIISQTGSGFNANVLQTGLSNRSIIVQN